MGKGATARLSRPRKVHDKGGVNDPHDNPSLQIDEKGYLWIFVSGRGQLRPGFLYKSNRPYQIESWSQVLSGEFTYPQPWCAESQGFLHLFTRYTAGRELYWNRIDPGGTQWSEPEKLAGFGGHYQISNQDGKGRVITFFNWHPDGDVDRRTNLYFLQSTDRGNTWTTVDGKPVHPPITHPDHRARIHDFQSEGRLVYLKDCGLDGQGNPVVLVITSNDSQAGPVGNPRWWIVLHWTGEHWEQKPVTQSTHNYDMGSLYLDSDPEWQIIAPTEPGPQYWGTGGEVVLWTSPDQGMTWKQESQLTQNSSQNQSYVRRPVHCHPGFQAFWADGNADAFSESHLYFYDGQAKKVHKMPYTFPACEG